MTELGNGNATFVLISADQKYIREVYKKLESDQRVRGIHPLFGQYNLIAKIYFKTFEEVQSYVSDIESMEGVTETKTLTGSNV